ncbi:BOLA class I histocompatibility antigen, alpha chain BL3-7 isoform X2 [Ictalurus punctatus]|uniref:BOLA class I histocompatibility antigen, alpha chain BL3-7 isoform X2 n=1 Tax=Ictalurus punctatus TaxID=7998 RepID=A0A2D0PPX8_ICTPU|nr:BOLA class I histocompatibility antigen, alpha chain BL3-7 isoform X2 [Ictalurus punctatus]
MMEILFLFTACFLHVSADTHSLQHLYTAVTSKIHFPSVEFTAVDLLNGEQITSYNGNNQTLIPKDWIKNITEETYWKSKTQDMQGNQETFTRKFTTVMESFNHSNGHTLQRMYGCERDDDNTIRGYDVYGYDGEDFISLDLKTGTWTAASAKAVNIKHKWKSKEAKYQKNYLENECIEWLAKDRKVCPEASVFQKNSSSPEVVCHATGFFPKTVMITWQKDGEDVHEGVDLRETLPNQDGSFQKRSILTVSAEDLQKHTYTCVIQHSSLETDIIMPVRERPILRGRRLSRGRIGVIAAVAVVFVAIVAGIVVWKRYSSGFRNVPQNISSSGGALSSNNSV